MTSIAAFFAKPAIKYGALVLALLALAGGVVWILSSTYSKGETAGKATITDAVQTKTITDLDKARQTKEKADEAVRATPYADRVDSLR